MPTSAVSKPLSVGMVLTGDARLPLKEAGVHSAAVGALAPLSLAPVQQWLFTMMLSR